MLLTLHKPPLWRLSLVAFATLLGVTAIIDLMLTIEFIFSGNPVFPELNPLAVWIAAKGIPWLCLWKVFGTALTIGVFVKYWPRSVNSEAKHFTLTTGLFTAAMVLSLHVHWIRMLDEFAAHVGVRVG